jgi:hypothetical protein
MDGIGRDLQCRIGRASVHASLDFACDSKPDINKLCVLRDSAAIQLTSAKVA